MFGSRVRALARIVVMSLFCAAIAVPHQAALAEQASAKEIWRAKIEGDAQWSHLTFLGSLLIATKSGLHLYDADTGALLWARKDLGRLAPFNVQEIGGTPYILVNDHSGGINSKTTLQVLDQLSGETVWTTGALEAYNLGAYPVPEHGLVILATNVLYREGAKAGVYLQAYAVENGQLAWEHRLAGASDVQQHMADNSSGWFQKFDLSGHQAPVVADGTLYVPFKGLAAYDIRTGEQKWAHEFRTVINDAKHSAAAPLVHDGVVYAAGRKEVYAYNAATGEQLWMSASLKGPLPEMQVAGDRLVVRQGGTFSTGKEVITKKPFGVAVLDRHTGALLSSFSKAKDNVTSLLVANDGRVVYFADKERLMGLDIESGNILVEHKLAFEHEIGTAEMAAKGLAIGSGLLSGGLTGALQGAARSSSDRRDAPLDVSALSDGALAVRGQSHILAYDPATAATKWSYAFAAPRAGNFGLIAMGAVTMLNAAANTGLHSSWSARDSAVNRSLNVAGSFSDLAARRYQAAARTDQRVYFLTNLEQGGANGPGVVALSLVSGSEAARLFIGDKEPQYEVDDLINRLYHIKDGDEIIAYQM